MSRVLRPPVRRYPDFRAFAGCCRRDVDRYAMRYVPGSASDATAHDDRHDRKREALQEPKHVSRAAVPAAYDTVSRGHSATSEPDRLGLGMPERIGSSTLQAELQACWLGIVSVFRHSLHQGPVVRRRWVVAAGLEHGFHLTVRPRRVKLEGASDRGVRFPSPRHTSARGRLRARRTSAHVTSTELGSLVHGTCRPDDHRRSRTARRGRVRQLENFGRTGALRDPRSCLAYWASFHSMAFVNLVATDDSCRNGFTPGQTLFMRVH